MKKLVFKCSQTVKKKNGGKVRCNRFICEIGEKITLVCAKCGTEYSLTQREDGLWEMGISIQSILKANFKGA